LVIGFSDITALLSAILTHLGLRTLHGPSVCQLGQKDGPHAPWQDLVDALEQASPRQPLQGLTTVFPGLGEGPLIGGNLTVLNHLVGTPWWPSLEGAVLLLEDVGERPYRLDRCLTQLRQARLLDGLAAVVLGDMTHCDARPPELPVWTWLEEFFTNLRVPTLRGLPVGHGRRNHPLPLGALVRVDATHGQVTFLEGAVA
jgi:muramoyltetrapeptide carboxypeptidase